MDDDIEPPRSIFYTTAGHEDVGETEHRDMIDTISMTITQARRVRKMTKKILTRMKMRMVKEGFLMLKMMKGMQHFNC